MTRAALLLALVLAGGLPAAAAPLATASSVIDGPADRLGGDIPSSDTALHRPPAPPQAAPAANPLWAIPLRTLSETRERPPFAPTRKPPPVVSEARPRPPERVPPRAVAPEAPPLKLIGTIVGAEKGFGLFIDTANKDVVRLATGGSYHGWRLTAVRERAVVMEKDHLNQTLALPVPPPAQPATTAPTRAVAAEVGGGPPRHPLRHPPIDATNAYR